MILHTDEQVGKRHAAVAASRTFRNLRSAYALGKKRVLDAGCGYGEYLVLFGQGSLGLTTTPHEVAYGKKHGIDIREGNLENLGKLSLGEKFDAVWANNIFEHLLSPHSFLITLKPHVTNGAHVILGVPVVPVFPALMRLRRFRGALANSHINFFTRATLRLTAEYAGWVVEDVRPFFFRNPYLDRLVAPIAPHLYLVARNNPDFAYAPKKLKEWQGDAHYAELLSIVGPKTP